MAQQKSKTRSKAIGLGANLFGHPAGNLTVDRSNEAGSPGLRRTGPPNRMNDLPYREWMKFQKSFFRFAGWGAFVQECILFFTKEIWPDSRTSRILILGATPPEPMCLGEREIMSLSLVSTDAILTKLRELNSAGQKFDFIFANLDSIDSVAEHDRFLAISDDWLCLLRALLLPERYCGLAVDWPAASVFPIPWSLAMAGRKHFRLRDEKIGLDGDGKTQHYSLFFQANGDLKESRRWFSRDTQLATEANKHIPSWLMPKSPPRKAEEVLHPAKFPESLVEQFVEIFSAPGDTIFDPMAGTGSALVAAVKAHRNAVGIELNPEFAAIARNRTQLQVRGLLSVAPRVEVIAGDARRAAELLAGKKTDYCVTSPPYWSMLSNSGSENQQARRERNLPTVYSSSEADLGNISSYDQFLDALVEIYERLQICIVVGGHLTVIVKNIKRNHIVYPLAWDLVNRLARVGGPYRFVGQTLWCQDDIGIKPFAVGIYWVSNTLHHYCLHFQKD
jgi:DNA modification methylase